MVGELEAKLFNSACSCKYKIIFGYNFLRAERMHLCMNFNIVDWLGTIIRLKLVDPNMLNNVDNIRI